MTWNYRKVELTRLTGEKYYNCCEVYYGDDGKPIGCCNASLLDWEDDDSLDGTMRMIAEAADKPILTEEDFK